MTPMGGTELMTARIDSVLSDENRKIANIVHADYREPIPGKVNIFVLHDMPHEKGAQDLLRDDNYKKFDAIVCVSHWQRQRFIEAGFHPSHLVVMQNFIKPIWNNLDVFEYVDSESVDDPIRFIYHSTPHRGLEELAVAFAEVSRLTKQEIHLDVYSSFALYGRKDLDSRFQATFDLINSHPNMTLHGTVSNDQVRDALKDSHAFVYPCKWHETSCLALVEAAAAGLDCYTTDSAALLETAARVNAALYETAADSVDLVMIAATMISDAINKINDRRDLIAQTLVDDEKINTIKRVNTYYGYDTMAEKWNTLIKDLYEWQKR